MGTDAHRKKVAFILPNFNAGGAERVMITVANHLDRRMFDPLIIAFDDSGPLRSLVNSDVRIVALGASRVSRGLTPYIGAIRKERPDVVISTMVHLNFIVLLARLFVSGVPVIVREAVTPSYFSGKLSKRLILQAGYMALYPFADKIVSPTRMVFDEMPWVLRRMEHKMLRIFNPVDLEKVKAPFDPGLRSLHASPGQKLFVAAGRLVDQKGFDLLIDGLSGWRERNDWRLLILGEGPDHQKLQTQIDRSGLSQVSLLGFVSEPWRYYAVADAFLLPSRHEGLPNVALEALAMGAPVIAAHTAGGIAEIAHECGNQAVQITQAMTEFTDCMDRISRKDPERHASLLPDTFSTREIVSAYQRIFSEI
ncbi:MAG: glycosyltransferase [Micavibrio aeruginosavorus]|uniref:Glycosyltransferase n=1 Tax=Micavibrio aeruginosavorus TaxID=349221 RepID=A0A7T5R2G6_9BACT|nr:MAG: glycosyltransferase [Micavibrio aeruginosavorus]